MKMMRPGFEKGGSIPQVKAIIPEAVKRGVHQHVERLSSIPRRAHGTEFEQKAEKYLSDRGYRLIARNVTFKSGEIDLIFEKREAKGLELVFVEVRKRAHSSYVQAEESVTFPKWMRMKSAIQQFLVRYKGQAQTMRIDLVAFQDDQIRHYRNYFQDGAAFY